MLSQHPMHRVQDIIDRWRDWIHVDIPVSMFLVQPLPPNGANEIFAHVILVQRPQPHTRAALISVVEMLDDPWNPIQFSVFLLTEVNHEQLLDEATVSSPFLPLNTPSGARR